MFKIISKLAAKGSIRPEIRELNDAELDCVAGGAGTSSSDREAAALQAEYRRQLALGKADVANGIHATI
ncbi:hypothetical protein ACRAWG_35290 [Methylobacterium sp. P31]